MFRLAKKVGTIGPELAEQQMCKNGLMRAKEVTAKPERSRFFSAVMATLDDKRSYKGDAKRSGMLTDSYIRHRARLGNERNPGY